MSVSSPSVSKRSGPSLVWLIPLITIIVGGWLVVKTLSEQGPRATISFKTAEGIEVDTLCMRSLLLASKSKLDRDTRSNLSRFMLMAGPRVFADPD